MIAGRGAGGHRMLPTLLAFAAVLLFGGLWLGGAHDTYFALFRLLGVPAFRFPFLDTHGELAVIDCHRLGYDVYRSNPCDVLGRVHVYTPLWYRADWLPIGAGDTPMLGLALLAAFALSLGLLPIGNKTRAAWIVSLAVLSPAVAFAMERGNVDLLMFILAALAGWLAVRPGPSRFAAYPAIVLAAALKVYPATLLIIALRERPRVCLAAGGLSVAALLAYAAAERTGLRQMLAVVPGGTPFIHAFGARDLAVGLGVVAGWPPILLAVLQVLLLLLACGFALARQSLLRPAVAALTDAEALGLLIGGVLIVGCFVLGQSGEYRAVHLLFVLPALCALAVAGPARRLMTITLWIILAQLWGDLASGLLDVFGGIAPGEIAAPAARALWLVRELAWWWIVAVLLALLLAVVQGLPAVVALRERP
jgi:hypothetical protein